MDVTALELSVKTVEIIGTVLQNGEQVNVTDVDFDISLVQEL